MQVFKFGGASVNSADAVRNMTQIVSSYLDQPLVVVVSAMGKTTNALERLVPGTTPSNEERDSIFSNLVSFHHEIIEGLWGKHFAQDEENPIHEAVRRESRRMVLDKVNTYFELLRLRVDSPATSYNFDYDQVVSFGEIISTTIISEYLNFIAIHNRWVDVRDLIRTDANYREGHVDWAATQLLVSTRLLPLLAPRSEGPQSVVVTQGFIAGTVSKTTTTLGREGSDYSAAILSHCLGAEEMTIWKDVPGFLNADPKFFKDTVKIEQIPYNEAIELAYYGASVIHPKTVKPLQNKNIKLNIKSFLDPQAQGSVIGPYEEIKPLTPLYIFKNNQVLLSIMPKDFSFIAEDNLQTIFAALANANIRVNLMQNSALSFSLCVDHNDILLNQLQELLQNTYKLRYNENLQLITIRYYTQDIIDQIVAGRPILLQQRSRTTIQLIVENKK